MSAKPLALFFLFTSLLFAGFLAYQSTRGPVCANTLSCRESLTEKIEPGAIGTFNGQSIISPDISQLAQRPTQVLGDSAATGPKIISINLTNQTLTAKQGDSLFLQTLVSTGKWTPTPTGEFTIWTKFRATRMSGGEGNDYYNLPNVPFTMFFSGSGIPAAAGYALHGAYWHNNFGHPMSHGCVNLRTIDAEQLFYWVDGSTTITIYGQAPL